MTLPRVDALGLRAYPVTGSVSIVSHVLRTSLSELQLQVNPVHHHSNHENGSSWSPAVQLAATAQSPAAHRGPDRVQVALGRRLVRRAVVGISSGRR